MAEEEFHAMEESLKDFLCEAQSDNHNSRTANFYKYNNLKVFMDPNKSKLPHFIVRIGISEAMFDIAKGEKLSGGLGPDEKLVYRWVARNLDRIDFGSVWKKTIKPKIVSVKDLEE